MQKTRQALLLMLVIILSVSFLAPISAQSTVGKTAVNWNKTFGPVWGQKVLAMEDGGFVIAGTTGQWIQTRGPGNWVNNSAVLIKIDSQGNMQWTKNYASINDIRDAITTSDDGYAILGGYRLTKANSKGEIEWQKNYTDLFRKGEYWGTAWSVIQTKDGGFAIVGFKSVNGHDEKGVFVKTDSNGNVQWNKNLGGDNPGNSLISVIEVDDGYTLAGATGYLTAGVLNQDMWLVKTNLNGEVQWEKRYGGTSSDACASLIKSSDSGYVLAGHTDPGAYVVKTDSDGNMQWTQSFNEITGLVFMTSAQTVEGGYIFAGDNGKTGVIAKYSASGKLQWSQNFAEGESPYIRSVAVDTDGNYFFVGTKGLEQKREIWAFKQPFDNLPSETFIPTQTVTPSSNLQAWAVQLTVLIVIVAFFVGLTVLFKRKKAHTKC